MNWLAMLTGTPPDVTLALPALAAMVLLGSLLASTMALRRSRTIARSSEALLAQLAVFKDAAVSLGQHLDRRGAAPIPVAVVQERHGPPALANSQPLHVQGAELPLSSAPATVPDTQRAFELARQGASIDDLVAACDVSRTEAGLMLAMSRRGRRVLGA